MWLGDSERTGMAKRLRTCYIASEMTGGLESNFEVRAVRTQGESVETNFADRLTEAIRTKNAPVCVGLDPILGRLPRSVLEEFGRPDLSEGADSGGPDFGTATKALLAYGREVIRIVSPHVPAIKINIAFFEPFYAEGIQTYFDLVREASDAGLIVIGDVKRADIGHSSNQYAAAQLGGAPSRGVVAPDAVTVNPYFGLDAINPFITIAREKGRGLFVLVQTSNASAAEVQGLTLSDGSSVGERVAAMVQGWATESGLVGASGYSCIGAVVSPRDLPSTIRIRTLMPQCLFLVPGFGAQGRTTEEVARCFKPDGSGAIVTASRSVIYAYQQPEHEATTDWQQCIDQACREFVRAVQEVIA